MDNKIKEIFKKCGSLLKGHFLLSSGLHSDTYCQMAFIFQYPQYGEEITKEIGKMFEGEKIDVVVGPAIGGIIFSYELGKVLKTRSVFTERENGEMQLRRGFKINKGEKVLICEDVITTGKSVKEVIEVVKECGGIIIGIACIMERGEVEFGFPVKSLMKAGAKNYYQPSECPLCKKGIPLTKLGSREQRAEDRPPQT